MKPTFQPATINQIQQFLSRHFIQDAEKFVPGGANVGTFQKTASNSNGEMQRDVYVHEKPRFKTTAIVTQKADGTITANAQTVPNTTRGTKDSFMHSVTTDTTKPDWQWKTPTNDQSFRALRGNQSIEQLQNKVRQSQDPAKVINYNKALDGFRAIQGATRQRQAAMLPADAQFRMAVKTGKPKEALFALQNGAKISPNDSGTGSLISRLMIESKNPETQHWLGSKMIEKILVSEQAQDFAKMRLAGYGAEGTETKAKYEELEAQASKEGKDAPKLEDITYEMSYKRALPLVRKDIEEFRSTLQESIPQLKKVQQAIRKHQAITPRLESVQDYRFRSAVRLNKPDTALDALEKGSKISSTDLGGKNIVTRLNRHSQDSDTQRWLGSKMINKIKDAKRKMSDTGKR